MSELVTLFHISEDGAIERFDPRPPPPGAVGIGPEELVVWAIDEAHLHNYLLPRDCPRVTFCAGRSTAPDEPLLRGTTAGRVIAVEAAWLERIRATPLFCYALPANTFGPVDASAGYHVSRVSVSPTGVRRIDDPLADLLRHDVELRVLPSLWKLYDAVIASTVSYSIIRMRNAQARVAD
jgi:hypothetical protein